MKNLKYFESSQEEDYLRDYGTTPDELIYFFTDLIDEGWIVRTRFYKKLYKFDVNEPMKEGDVKLGLIPYIGITVTKNWPRFETSIYQANKELTNLINSNTYLGILDVASNRLKDIGLFIQRQYIENKQLNILIYRKTDENYIK